MALSAEELTHCEAVAVEAAKAAGEVIAGSFYKMKRVENKGAVDLVTETDKACEDLIFGFIQTAFPSHKFIGEEGSSIAGTAALTEEPTWMVDPLDGTTNFVHMFPFVCVSIGLVVERQMVVGVVYNPVLQELFTAVRGRGAFLNGSQIHTSKETDLGKALVATEIGTKRDTATVEASTNRIKELLYKVRSLRLCGSCAMNLCGVACGRLDAFYEIGFGGPWDVAAGALILEEAGGIVCHPDGGPFQIMSRQVVGSANEVLKKAFVGALGV
eukprot:TRINITY_DN2292_c0_g1_i1.p1 TRINITY_DN2292_c0_g1~~TRINITY_DN2292_c0_g1_i1.p1  ORF type:complete len:271 (+),score=54.54 TRINITY_DN2292_c0_g1_i1:261-1073(+)